MCGINERVVIATIHFGADFSMNFTLYGTSDSWAWFFLIERDNNQASCFVTGFMYGQKIVLCGCQFCRIKLSDICQIEKVQKFSRNDLGHFPLYEPSFGIFIWYWMFVIWNELSTPFQYIFRNNKDKMHCLTKIDDGTAICSITAPGLYLSSIKWKRNHLFYW